MNQNEGCKPEDSLSGLASAKWYLLLVPMLLIFALGVCQGATQLTNSQIAAGIQDRLYHARIYDHGRADVQFQHGVATLTGTVDSYGAKLDAERAARKQKGVVAVVDHISVNPGNISSLQILRKARYDILTYPHYTIFDHLALEARGNTLIVGGQVDEPYKKSDLSTILAHIKGVSYLENRIQVLPTSFFDNHVRWAVARAIYFDPYFVNYAIQSNPPIHIIVDNGNVTLYGIVGSPVTRARAMADARFATTYFSLKDDIQIA